MSAMSHYKYALSTLYILLQWFFFPPSPFLCSLNKTLLNRRRLLHLLRKWYVPTELALKLHVASVNEALAQLLGNIPNSIKYDISPPWQENCLGKGRPSPLQVILKEKQRGRALEHFSRAQGRLRKMSAVMSCERPCRADTLSASWIRVRAEIKRIIFYKTSANRGKTVYRSYSKSIYFASSRAAS
jgi:hypothetical protein